VLQGALSAITLLDSTGLASRLAKPIFKKYKNREVIALSVEALPSKIILMMQKNQESSKFQRIKSQASFKNQDQDSSKESRLKIQESREDSIKISIKRVFQNIE